MWVIVAREQEEIKRNNTKRKHKNDKFNNVTKENIKTLNSILLQVPDVPYRILIIGDSGSQKTKST